MSKPLAVIIRFPGDPEELLERFERARQLWIEAQDDDYERPLFYAACRTDIEAVGLTMPAAIERMQIEKLGWD